jgi:multiple sugar transport system substrate-binding protein
MEEFMAHRRESVMIRSSGLARIITLILGLALLASCGTDGGSATTAGGAGEPAATPAELEGSLKFFKGPFSADEVTYEQVMIDGFQTLYPNLTVDYEAYDWPSMEAQITASLASGEHDVYYLPGHIYPKYAFAGGPLADLTEFVNDPSWSEEHDKMLFWEEAGSVTPDGILAGVPYVWIPQSNLFVNMDLLEEAGVGDEWMESYDAMLSAAEQVQTSIGGDTVGITLRTSGMANFSHFDWYGYILRGGGDFLTEDGTACGMNTPEVVESFQFLVDLQQSPAAPAFGAFNWDGLRALFLDGRAAFHHDEPLFGTDLRNAGVEFTFEQFPIPPGPVNQDIFTNPGFLVIGAQSDNQEAAWEMIKYWVSRDVLADYLSKNPGLWPARTDVVSEGLLYADDPMFKTIGEDWAELAHGPLMHSSLNEFFSITQAFVDRMLQGELTPQEAIEQACAEIEAEL